MNKKKLTLLAFGALIIILILGKTGIINIGSSKDVFYDEVANYEVIKSSIISSQGEDYAVIELNCENKSNTDLVPWENSSFIVEQDGPSRVIPLERVTEYNKNFGNEDSFNKAKEKFSQGEKSKIELVYKVKFKDSPVYIRGLSNGNNFEYTIK